MADVVSPAETIVAAIEKLEKTREHYLNQGMYMHHNDEYGYLWRIIDPQVAILSIPTGHPRMHDAQVALARAILDN